MKLLFDASSGYIPASATALSIFVRAVCDCFTRQGTVLYSSMYLRRKSYT